MAIPSYERMLDWNCLRVDGKPTSIEEALADSTTTGVIAGATMEESQLLAIKAVGLNALPDDIQHLICVNFATKNSTEELARKALENGASLLFDGYELSPLDLADPLITDRFFPEFDPKNPEGFARDDFGSLYWDGDIPANMVPILLDMHIMSSFRGDVIERARLAMADFAGMLDEDETFCVPSLVECLSFGMVEHPIPSLLPPDPVLVYASEAIPPSAEIKALEPYREFISKIDDIIAIWSNYIYNGITEIGSPEDCMKAARGKTLSEIGSMVGIDSAVRSYIDGIELEDILIHAGN